MIYIYIYLTMLQNSLENVGEGGNRTVTVVDLTLESDEEHTPASTPANPATVNSWLNDYNNRYVLNFCVISIIFIKNCK